MQNRMYTDVYPIFSDILHISHLHAPLFIFRKNHIYVFKHHTQICFSFNESIYVVSYNFCVLGLNSGFKVATYLFIRFKK